MLAFGMFGGSAWLENEAIEMTLIMCSVLLASYSLGKSYLTKHRQIRPLLWLIPGFAFLFLAHDLPGNWHHYLMALGGFTLAFAHYVNWRLLSNRAPALA
ncbi:MAG: MerC family mercury resistance protein [Bacteroidota bacterium]